MSTFASEARLDVLISHQRNSISSYIAFAVGLFVLGVAIIVAVFLIPQAWLDRFSTSADGVKSAFGSGGLFVTSLLSLPVREVVKHRGKIHLYKHYKQQLEDLKSIPATKRAKEQKRLDDLIWDCMQKAAME
jgi:hypothetical protein